MEKKEPWYKPFLVGLAVFLLIVSCFATPPEVTTPAVSFDVSIKNEISREVQLQIQEKLAVTKPYVYNQFPDYSGQLTYYYNTAGRIITPNGQHPAVFDDYVTPTTATGNTIDYSIAHFTSAPVITVTAEQNTSAITSMPLISIATKSATSCTVNVLTSNQQPISVLGTSVTGLMSATGLTTMKIHIHAKGYTTDNFSN